MQWIKVLDKIPELNEHNDSENVLVASDQGILVASLTFYPTGGYRKTDDYTWEPFETGCGCCSCGSLEVTHWMPLPELPVE